MNNMYKEILEQSRVILDCKEANYNKVKEITKELKDIDKIIMVARGTSDHSAIYGKYIMEILLKKPVGFAAASVVTLYESEVNLKNALVIGISQSGMGEDVLLYLKQANKTGAKTIAITNTENSPVAKEAMWHLCCSAGLEKSVAATKTFTAQNYILALLTAMWAENKELLACLEKLPQEIENQLKNSDEYIELASRYKFASECIVLARGLLYPVALEGALKLQETTYTKAKGFPISDFEHGPLALIDKNSPVIIYVNEDETKECSVAMIQKLYDLQADLLIVANDEALKGYSNKFIKIPKLCKYTAIFNATLIAQLLACGLAKAKNLDPDAPRSIKKVTITK